MQVRTGSVKQQKGMEEGSSAQCQLARYRTNETQFDLPGNISPDAWQAKAMQLRHQILASAGLLPFPERTPLRPRVLGRLEREGYAIENVYMETMPGLILCGNLYRSLNIRPGVPAVLSPHGHGRYGRFEADGWAQCRVDVRLLSVRATSPSPTT